MFLSILLEYTILKFLSEKSKYIIENNFEHLFDYSITEQMFFVNTFFEKIEQMFDKDKKVWYIKEKERVV